MTNNIQIVEKLSQFNNLSFTKKQWEIILKGCGCPKSCFLWRALRANNLVKQSKIYTLVDINIDSFDIVWNTYCKMNRASVKRVYDKNKARKRCENMKGITFYMLPDGSLTVELSKRD